jgi:hypothetical protein
VADKLAAGIDDKGIRRQQCFDVVEPQKPLHAARDQPRGGDIEDMGHAFDLGQEQRDAGLPRGASVGGSSRKAM